MGQSHKPQLTTDKVEHYLRLVIQEVEKAIEEENPPFAAILINKDGKIVASSHNTTTTDKDPTAHGEINALRLAGKALQTKNLSELIAVVNTEPCAMCMAAFIKAGIREVYFGATQEEGNNPDLRASEIIEKSSFRIILQGGFLEAETKQQVARGRKSAQGLTTAFK